MGKVLKKNIPLIRDTLCFGKLTATKHANGRDWWIIVPKYNKPTYFIYLLTPQGIDTFPPQTIGNPTFSNEGQATFSPDGTKYVRLNNLGYEYGAWMDICDFDRCTGKLSNYQGFYKSVGGSAGVSISPNSRFLYFSRGITVHQYDLWASDVEASEKLVATYDDFANPLPTNFWMSQLAPDGKIYVGSNSSVKNYHIIQHPDRLGLACDFEQHAISLPTIAERSIPTFPYYRLGPLDGSSCDTLGINNLPVADFRIDKTADTFSFELVDLSYYNPTTWHWDFGDATQSLQQNPVHTYPAAGTYQICLIASNEYAADTICKTITVGTIVSVNEPEHPGYQMIAVPNPANDYLTIAYSSPVDNAVMTVQLINTVGAIVTNMPLTGWQGTQQMELSQLPVGLYYLRFVANGQVISVQKISIIH
ncbi:MAG: PKD domain-containing protein [Saprospiraceae bacterium]